MLNQLKRYIDTFPISVIHHSVICLWKLTDLSQKIIVYFIIIIKYSSKTITLCNLIRDTWVNAHKSQSCPQVGWYLSQGDMWWYGWPWWRLWYHILQGRRWWRSLYLKPPTTTTTTTPNTSWQTSIRILQSRRWCYLLQRVPCATIDALLTCFIIGESGLPTHGSWGLVMRWNGVLDVGATVRERADH